jgi:uroporphyrinogen decarboxylase
MSFERPDKLPWYEWPWNEVIYRWIGEGLPISQIIGQKEDYDMYGALPYSISLMTLDVSRYFGFEVFTPPEYTVIIDATCLPRFFSKTIEETTDYLILRSIDGSTKKYNRKETFSMPMWLEWPVKNKNDWEQIKTRLDPTDPRRYPKEWSGEYVEHLKAARFPVAMCLCGFYGLGRTYMGTVPFLSSFYRDPELVKDMIDFQANFLIESTRKAVETLRSSIDIVIIHEDMSYKHGPHISPKLFREFMLSGYKKLTGFLRKNRIDNVFVDTDGNIAPLIPLLLEGGVNGLFPLEVAAGMDAVALRKEYGKSLRLIGNIDKRALAKGRPAIERELESKLPLLKESGGFIPMIDHVIPPDISLENFKYYSEHIKKFL